MPILPIIPIDPTPFGGSSFQDEIRLLGKVSGDEVKFLVTPNIDVNSRASYMEIADIRQAASLLIYVGSPGRTFNLSIKLVSRTQEEATKNFEYLHRLRAWRTPQDKNAEPEVLRLWGYKFNFRGIPVVVDSLSENWNDDFDTILAANGSAMPIILPLSLSLKEAQNKDDILSGFNYQKFKSGTLAYW